MGTVVSSSLDDALDVAARPLRGMSGLAWVTIAGAAAIAVLAIGAWLMRLGVLDAPLWVMVVWLLLVATLVAGVVAGSSSGRVRAAVAPGLSGRGPPV